MSFLHLFFSLYLIILQSIVLYNAIPNGNKCQTLRQLYQHFLLERLQLEITFREGGNTEKVKDGTEYMMKGAQLTEE